jgi:hypothetical protein
MDWLDQYLDALSESKNVVYPPDSFNLKKPNLSNSQKRLIFDSMADSEAEMKMLFEKRMNELYELEHDSAALDAGDVNQGSVINFSISQNNQVINITPVSQIINFTVSNDITSFTLDFGIGSVSILNNFDVNNFYNCYLSAFNFVNSSMSYNPVFVTASETLFVGPNLYTLHYTNTGSALFTLSRSSSVEPPPSSTPTPFPSITPTRTLTVTPTVTPTRTPSSTPTPFPSITPTRTLTVTPTPFPSITPTRTLTVTPTVTPTRTLTVTPTVTPTRI